MYASASRVAARHRASLDDAVGEFFDALPALRKYKSRIRIREKEHGGGGSHGEARQHGNEIWLFPKFWSHDPDLRRWILAHEVGHWVMSDHGSIVEKANALGIDPWDSPSLPYGQYNMDEAFADCFAAYHLERAELRRRYPAWFRLIEAVAS